MKFFTFEARGQRHLGAEFKDHLIDLKAAHSAMIEARRFRPGARAAMPSDMLAFIRGGEPSLKAAQETLAFMAKRPAVPVGEQLIYPLPSVRVLAPLSRPGKILCSGMNHPSLTRERPGGKQGPVFFSKLPSTVIGPGEAIVLPKRSPCVDYGIELAAVIGHRMKDTPADQAMKYVFGYSILNDISAQDSELADNWLTLAKNFDTFCPLGPCIITQDELPDPGNVGLRAFVNGQVTQNSNNKEWLFSMPRLLSYLSGIMTLEPGDVVSSGMPASAGVSSRTAVFLKPDDIVRLEADGIGLLENPVAAARIRTDQN